MTRSLSNAVYNWSVNCTDKAGNVLLMHMNNNIAGAGQTIEDTSGEGNNGTVNDNNDFDFGNGNFSIGGVDTSCF